MSGPNSDSGRGPSASLKFVDAPHVSTAELNDSDSREADDDELD
jgi:hypothetical protein